MRNPRRGVSVLTKVGIICREGRAGVTRQDIRFTMPTIDEGKALHRMGRIAEAEAVYRSVLAHDQYGKIALEGLQKIGFKFEDEPSA